MSFESEYLELRKKRKKEEEEKANASSQSFQDEYLKLREKRLSEKKESPSKEDIAPVKQPKAKSVNKSVNKASADKVTVTSKGVANDTGEIDKDELTKRLKSLKKEREALKEWLKNPTYAEIGEQELKQETTPEARQRYIDSAHSRQYKNQQLVLRDLEYEIQDINDLLGNRTWFRKPEVGRDGYQDGEFIEGVLASGADFLSNVGEAIIGIPEKVIDTGATLAPYAIQANENPEGSGLAMLLFPEEYKALEESKKRGYEEFKGAASDFVAKDLYNEAEIAKTIITDPIKNSTGIDAEANSVFGERSDGLVQSATQVGVQAGLQAFGVPWWVTSALTGFGSQSEQALNEGANLDEATASAAITTVAEILFEKLGNGINFGGKTISGNILYPLLNKISSKYLRMAAKFGLDVLGEGTEEVLSAGASRLGTALYKEEDLKDILFSEEALDEYLEGFIGGSVLGGGSSAGSAIITTASGGDYVAELSKSQKEIVDKVTEDTIKKAEADGTKLTTKEKNEIRNKVIEDMKAKIEAYNKDRDAKTGLTKNEQAVFDKVYNDTIAKEEADGTKLSKAEKKKIYDATMNALKNGRIDTDTIEGVLGGEEYTNYKSAKDKLDSLQKEYDDIVSSKESAEKRANEIYNALKGKTPGKHKVGGYNINVDGSNITIKTPNGDTIYEKFGDSGFVSNDALWREVADVIADIEGHADIAPSFDRRAELETEINGLKGESTKARDLLDAKMRGLVKDSMLTESYAENIRRRQDFTLDGDIESYSKNKHVRETLENFVNHFEANNTREAHDYVDFLTKIAEDRNHSFDFMTTAQIEESIKNGNPYNIDIDPSKVEAFVSGEKRTIIINMDANKSLSSLVGHETTHTLEKLGEYDKLQEALFKYAQTKGEYEDRLASVQRRYNKLGEDGQKKELTADLLGEYIFSDPEFITNLSAEKPNLFQRIYNEIKYFCKMATTGSRELRELERVKHLMEKVWRDTETNTKNEANEFSDTETKLSIREEAPPKETGIAYKVFYVKDGKLYPPMVANPDGADTPMGVWLNADVGTAAPPSKTGRMQVKAGGKGTQGGSGSLAFRPGWHLGDLPRASQFDRVNPETGNKELFPENFVWAEVEYAKDVDYQEEAMSYGYTENGKFRHSYAGLPRLPENGYYRYRTNPRPDTVPWVITGAMKVNRLLSDAEVNSILEKNGVEPVHRQGGDVGLEKFGFNEDGSVKYSLAENTKADVKEALKDKFYAGEIKLTDSSPSILLSQKGVRNLPMIMNASHLRENILTEDEARKLGLRVNPNINYHGLGEDLFLTVIDELDDVTEAYRGTRNAEKSERRENYFLLISQHKDKYGNVINIPVYINEKGMYNRVFIDTNKISTVFGRSELRKYINEQVKLGNLVRIKKGSTQASESTSPINADYGMNASEDIISQNSEKSSGLSYSIATEYESLPKTTKTMTPTAANLKRNTASVRDVRNETMLKNKYTEDDVKQVNDFMDNMASFMEKAGVKYKYIGLDDVKDAKLKVVYDKNGNPKRITMSAMVANGDYPVNFDFTSICKKRQSMSMVIKELASRKDANGNRVLDTVTLDANSLWKINEELRTAGLETACLGCFVESKRYNVQNFANKAVNMWNSIVDEVRSEQGKTSPVGSFSFAEGVDLDAVNYDEIDQIFKAYNQVKGRTSPEARMRALIANGGEMYQKYLQPSDIMTPEGIEGLKSLSTKKNNLYGIIKGVYGQAAPKEVMGFSPYNSEVALLPDKKNGKPIAEYIASIGGVRMQSFSDFVVSNVYDYMQMVADLSARHLPAHAYTKEIAFAKIFGLTGIKINMSVMFDIDPTLPDEYAGLKFVPDSNGDEEYNGVKGRFEYLVGDKKRSDKVFEETGDRPYVQSIGFDEAVELQNTEGYSRNVGIIGVGFSDKHIIKMLGDNRIRYVIPYHASSLPEVIKGVTNIKKAKDYTPFQGTKTKDGETLAGLGGFDIYKDVAKTQNPKETADNYLWYCVENGYTPVFSQFTWHENYYKLLFDFDPYDTLTGEYSPQTEVSNVYKGYNPTEGNFSTAEVEQIIDDEMKTQNEANKVRNEKLPDVVDNVLEQLGIQSDRVGFRLADDAEYTPKEYGYFNTYAKDLAKEQDIAPTRETTRFATDYASLTEAEANARDSKRADSHYFLDDIAPEAEEMYNGNYADHVKPSDPFYEKDIWEVGKDRKAKAYMYEHPEVKPFFQEEARYMLGELDNSHKGEKFYNDQLYYDTNGEMGIFGTKRHTSEDIAYLLDSFNYTYKDIAKGLKAIIEDNGKENNAISKRIEFLLDERLRNGYTDFWFGDKIPPNQEYINLLNSKQITEYNDESWNNWLRSLSDDDINQYFSAKKRVDVSSNYYAPATEQTVPKNANGIAPTQEAPLYEDANGQQAMFETQEAETKPKLTRSSLHSNIINDLKSNFAVLGYDFDEVLKNAKNLSTFATVDNTPQRVMEKALGYEQGQALADVTVNKVAQNETEGIKWLNSYTDRKNGLLAQISKQYHIKPGSKESAAAQMYAEGFYVNENNEIIQYGDQELAKDFPDLRTQLNIKGLATDERIRQIYDDTLARINESRTRNAYPEIPRLDNYFLHFRAMEDTFSRLGLPFNPNDIRAKDLPTDLNGVTADLKPGQPYFASANHRTGKRTSFDLLGGLERYLTSAKNQIYHIDDIQTLRALRNYIADTYGQANGLEGIDALSEEEAQDRIEKVYGSHLSTFAKFLNEEANVLAGKTALIDRGLEGIIGRRGITFLDTLNRQVGSNMVGYSASSAIVNLDALPRAIAKLNKFDVVKAFAQYTSNKVNSIFGRGDDFADQNPVIIRRKGADRFYRNFWQNLSDKGYFAMGIVDDFTTEVIARAKYNELTRKGMDSQKAHFETDKWVSKLMGDRSLGQMPQIFNSKMLGMITKFQLEVRNNLDSQFYDTIQEAKVSNKDIQSGLARNAKTAAKVTSTLVQLAIGQHLFGKAFESIAGYNPSFDIVSALLTAFGYDDDEDSEDDVLDNVGQAFLGLLDDMPYSSVITGGGRIPISSALPSYEQFEQLVTGEDEYGNEKSRWATLGGVAGEIAPYYFMPGGFGQLKKTVKGLSMFDDDLPISGSYTDSGNLRFPVEDTVGNRIQAGLFGQWASKNAREYFDNDYAPLKPKQIEEFIDVDLPYKDYQEYRQGLSGMTKLNEKGDYIANLDMPTSKKNILINNIADREKPIDLTDYDKYADFEEFDFATRYPDKYKVLQEQGISVHDYKENFEESVFMHTDDYSWAADNSEKYTLSKAITSDVTKYKQYTSELNSIKADKDANGNSIPGSAKEKKAAYIDSLDLDYGQKAILYRSYFDSKEDKKTYNRDILNYLNGRNDLTYEEKITILEELDFKVYADGRVEW